ncbi:MAG: hypothetical protein JEZ07_09180 [Phycisphaerae bacterium]|nr:hypothetical protein [Phycisphaerae bacterium]
MNTKAQKKLILSDYLRQAINGADMSRYAICKATGIDQASMCRFMAGKTGLSSSHWDALGTLLDLEIVKKRKVGK